MMSQQKLASSIGNREIHQDNSHFMSAYWQYFPCIGISASSLIDALISVIAVALIAVLYTIIYIGIVAFRMLVQVIGNALREKMRSTRDSFD